MFFKENLKMKQLSKRLIATAILASLAAPGLVQATNGYFMIGFGAKSRGMGGVGVAEGVDGFAGAYNPATMIDVGTRFDIGGDMFWAPNVVTHSDGTLSETTILEESQFPDTGFSRGGIFLIPGMGGMYKINDDLIAGFTFIGAGLGTQYDQSIPATATSNQSYFFNFNQPVNEADNKVGIKLLQMQIPLSVAYRLNKKHTVGASFVIAGQFFEAWGLQAFDALGFTGSPGKISNEGTKFSYGAGIRLGWQGKYLGNDLLIGANYSSRVYMTKWEDYENLFAEKGDFDIPENYTVGIAYKGIDKFNLKFDVQQINYSDIASVGNPGPLAYNSTEFNPLCPGEDTAECKLGGDLGLGFGWSDQTVFKFGAEYKLMEKLSLRGGFNYGKITIAADQVLFNLVAPATIEKHLTFGATYHWSSDIELSASYVHAFESTLEGPTMFQPLGSNPDVTSNNAAISMKQRSMGATLAIKW
jgi:long-chain fatty acid transport protein